jgi:hypothetical protein
LGVGVTGKLDDWLEENNLGKIQMINKMKVLSYSHGCAVNLERVTREERTKLIKKNIEMYKLLSVLSVELLTRCKQCENIEN